MTRPGTFERVYLAIKGQLREGRFRPGDRLEPAAMSEHLNASVTPVRDALHRLTGERFLEAPPHEGFRVPLLTETALRHLFSWHRDLVLLAIASRRVREGRDRELPGGPASDPRLTLNAIFLALAKAAGNPEHVLALEALIERLEPVQRLEGLLLDAVEEESAAIGEAFLMRDSRALRKALIHYHRRRERIVPELLDRLYAG